MFKIQFMFKYYLGTNHSLHQKGADEQSTGAGFIPA